MRKLTKTALKEILAERLRLKNPRFRLDSSGGKFFGSVISETFSRKGDLKRQRMIWDALDAALGATSFKHVGMILAYTPDEWDFADADVEPRSAKAKARSSRASIMNRSGS